MFALRQKYKNELNDLIQGLVELTINCLYGVQIRRDIDQSYEGKSQLWMATEYDDNVLEYWRFHKR